MAHQPHEVSDQQWHALLDAARTHGQRYGQAVADMFDLTVTGAGRLLPLIEQGSVDEEMTQALPGDPLSGEYAGQPTPASLYAALGIEAGQDSDDAALCQAYEDGFDTAVSDRLAARCRHLLGLPEPGDTKPGDTVPAPGLPGDTVPATT